METSRGAGMIHPGGFGRERERTNLMTNPDMRDDVAGAGAGWELWRQDDNGNRFLIGRFDSQAAADAEQRRFEALGHKQTYWVERPADPAPA